MNHAIILRCIPSTTKELLRWSSDNYPDLLWTPTITRTERLPRSRKKISVTRPAVPGYIFMAENQFPISAPLEYLKRKGCRPLWINGYFARCTMTELYAMHRAVQDIESRLHTVAATHANLSDDYPRFAPGDRVAVVEDKHFLDGVVGVVVSQKSSEVTIDTAGFWRTLKVSSFLLRQAPL